jgi:hypothetical protein
VSWEIKKRCLNRYASIADEKAARRDDFTNFNELPAVTKQADTEQDQVFFEPGAYSSSIPEMQSGSSHALEGPTLRLIPTFDERRPSFGGASFETLEQENAALRTLFSEPTGSPIDIASTGSPIDIASTIYLADGRTTRTMSWDSHNPTLGDQLTMPVQSPNGSLLAGADHEVVQASHELADALEEKSGIDVKELTDVLSLSGKDKLDKNTPQGQSTGDADESWFGPDDSSFVESTSTDNETISADNAKQAKTQFLEELECVVNLASESKKVRRLCRIASRPATPQFALAELAQCPNYRVRTAVAENPITSLDTLMLLAQDSEPSIRCLVAGSPVTPIGVLYVLAHDSDEQVRERAKKNLGQEQEQGHLWCDLLEANSPEPQAQPLSPRSSHLLVPTI